MRIDQKIPRASEAFNEIAELYDAWYDDNVLFQCELDALRKTRPAPPLSLEVGVGPGRFSQALGIQYGVDPAPRPLKLSRDRGIVTIQARAEDLPFKRNSLEQVYLIFSLCFLEDPLRALHEIRSVLKRGGLLIIGFVPKDSEWGALYEQKKREGHHLYRYASFFCLRDLISDIERMHFQIREGISSLFQAPGLKRYHLERPKEGIYPGAGFVVLVAERP